MDAITGNTRVEKVESKVESQVPYDQPDGLQKNVLLKSDTDGGRSAVNRILTAAIGSKYTFNVAKISIINLLSSTKPSTQSCTGESVT